MSIRVMTRVWTEGRHQGSTLVVLLAIADFADDEGNAYPSAKTLAKKARISERQVRVILKKLQYFGSLRISMNAGPHRCNLYTVTDFRVLKPQGVTDFRVLKPQGVMGNPERVLPITPKPSIEPSTPSGPSSDSEESSSVPTGVIYSPKNEIQEWYGILQKTKPFVQDWLEVEACRVKHGISEELALEKAYAVQAWWLTAPTKTKREGNPFYHWRNWCIREPKHASPRSRAGPDNIAEQLREKECFDEGRRVRLEREAELRGKSDG